MWPGFPERCRRLGKNSLPIPAIPFDKEAPSLSTIFNKPTKIFVTPSKSFVMQLRKVFQTTKLTHYTAEESRRWLAGPNMGYWPQQLNFAV